MSTFLATATQWLPDFHRDNTTALGRCAIVSVWIRWSVLAILFSYAAFRIAAFDETHLQYVIACGMLPLLANAWLHSLVATHRDASRLLFLSLGAMDAALVTIAVSMTSDLDSPLFALYYPVLAVFAAVFSSVRFNLGWVTLVSLGYATMSVFSGPGATGESLSVLATRIATFYSVALAVALVVGFERARRAEALIHEWELQQEQVELSQTIHDTAAQSAYMIGLGIESALAAADATNREQVAQLEATHALSKSAMWELRHPIDIGLIFEGRELSDVLRSHAATFSTITSVHTELMASGLEPALPAATRGLLFSIAHNAMTNAYRHAHASSVTIELDYGPDDMRLAISDNGCGLPEYVASNGHGLRNMGVYAQRMGGNLQVSCGEESVGTTVTCVVPYKCN